MDSITPAIKPMTLGEYLAKRRWDKSQTQPEAARAIGISTTMLWQLENDVFHKRGVSFKTAFLVCKYYDMTLDLLAHLDGLK